MNILKWCISYLNGRTKNEYTVMTLQKFSACAMGICHVVILFMMIYAKASIMVAVNIISILIYAASYFIAAKEKKFLFFEIIYIEVIIHLILAIIMLGDKCGFGLYCIALIPVTYYCYYGVGQDKNGGKKLGPFFLSCFSALIFILMKLYCNYFPPVYHTLNDKECSVFYIVNFIITIVSLVFFMSTFITQMFTLMDKLIAQNTRLDALSKTDSLTGLSTRRVVREFIENSYTNHTKFCVILADIDDFKLINDTYGHECGDKVLSTISDVFRSSIRQNDIVCRWGGEEILVILPKCDTKNAKQVAEKIKNTIHQTPIQNRGNYVRVSLTYGISSSEEAIGAENIIHLADKRLYYGKTKGKNCIIAANDNTLENHLLKNARKG